MSEITKDVNGKTSSKRITGIILTIAGGGLLIAVGVIAVFKQIADPETALRAGTTLIGSGVGLLGVGVLEHINRPSEGM